MTVLQKTAAAVWQSQNKKYKFFIPYIWRERGWCFIENENILKKV